MATEAILEARGLEKIIGGRAILKGLDFDLASGQVVGLLGKNGAGKSTLIDTLLGFALPTAGSCRVFGEESGRLAAQPAGCVYFLGLRNLKIDWSVRPRKPGVNTILV
jgi:ABC-2 type transport system ATP-binding protein